MLGGLFIFPGILVAFGVAFFVARLAKRRDRIAGLLAVLATPFIFYTLVFYLLIGLRTGPGGDAYWWFQGLADFALPLAVWSFAAVGGFMLGRAKRHSAD